MCKKDSNYFKVRLAAIMFDNYTIEERTKKIESFLNELNEYVNDDNSEEIKQLQIEIKRLKKELGVCYERIKEKDKLIKQANRKVIEQGNDLCAMNYKITELKCEIADLYMQIKRLTKKEGK